MMTPSWLPQAAVALPAALLAGLAAYAAVPRSLRSRRSLWLLVTIWALLTCGLCLNLQEWTAGGNLPPEHPHFENPDAAKYRDFMLDRAGEVCDHSYAFEISSHKIRYEAVMRVCYELFGRSIVPPLALNVAAILWAIVVCGLLGVRLVGGADRRRTFFLSMLLTALPAYWLNSGTLLLKDALMQWAVPTTLLTFSAIWRPFSDVRRYRLLLAAGVTAIIVTGVLRQQMLMPLLAVPLLCVPSLRSLDRSCVIAIAGWTILMLALMCSATEWLDKGMTPTDYTKREVLQMDFFQERPSQMPWLALIGDYANAPWWWRTLLLPLSAAVQYLIPLPWNALRDLHFGPTLVYAHQGWAWYAIGGAGLWYACTQMWRRREAATLMGRMAWWACAYFLGIAWLLAGTVSRYFLPVMPVVCLMALKAWETDRHRRTYKVWYASYLAALAAALALTAITG